MFLVKYEVDFWELKRLIPNQPCCSVLSTSHVPGKLPGWKRGRVLAIAFHLRCQLRPRVLAFCHPQHHMSQSLGMPRRVMFGSVVPPREPTGILVLCGKHVVSFRDWCFSACAVIIPHGDPKTLSMSWLRLLVGKIYGHDLINKWKLNHNFWETKMLVTLLPRSYQPVVSVVINFLYLVLSWLVGLAENPQLWSRLRTSCSLWLCQGGNFQSPTHQAKRIEDHQSASCGHHSTVFRTSRCSMVLCPTERVCWSSEVSNEPCFAAWLSSISSQACAVSPAKRSRRPRSNSCAGTPGSPAAHAYHVKPVC